MNTNLFDPWPLTLTPKVIWKNGAKIETYTWSSGKSIKFEIFLIPCLAPIDTNLFDPWPLTLTPKVIWKNGAKNRNLHLELRKINKVRIFSHPCLAPMDTNLFDPWPLTWPQRSYEKTAPKSKLTPGDQEINKVRIFSHPCLAPMDTNLFDPWPLTLTPKVIWKNGAKIETYTWSSGKSIKFEFFSPLPGAHGYQLIWLMTFDLDPKGHMKKTAPKSKLTPGAQENQ